MLKAAGILRIRHPKLTYYRAPCKAWKGNSMSAQITGRYGIPLIALHWLMLVLIVAIYAFEAISVAIIHSGSGKRHRQGWHIEDVVEFPKGRISAFPCAPHDTADRHLTLMQTDTSAGVHL